MSWKAEFNETMHIVELVCTGEHTPLDMQESTSRCVALGKEKGTNRFLMDATGVNLAPSFTDILRVPAEFFDEQADRLGRLAVLPPRSPTAREAAEFFEVACSNRGWMVQLFPNRHEAIEWLSPGNSSLKP